MEGLIMQHSGKNSLLRVMVGKFWLPGLDGDGGADGRPEGAVEGGCHEDDLGEAGGRGDGAIEGDAGAVGGDPMEGLGPPLVGGDAEPGNGGGVVAEEGDLFVEAQQMDERAGPGGDGKGSVAEGEGGVAGPGARELRGRCGNGNGGLEGLLIRVVISWL
ncbi:hypothetical protein CRG98_031993 [Punica granatum]|uniref:Uncharacterized protein n=1 Tax=Punica granatum TaxID=22663 RepID=A0A2I0IUD1_PUNGR|nr:hypothetical protein CRG98_031993 [Punica granatum]